MPATILVVEDQSCLKRMLVAALALKGLKVVSASNGFEALGTLKSQRVDLILTDWNMPVVNGEELIVELQGHPDTKQIPVVVLSCDLRPAHSRVNPAAIRMWLRKPCRISEIQNVVVGILHEGPLTDARELSA